MSTDWITYIAQTLVASVLSGAVVTTFVAWYLQRAMERYRANVTWKQQSLSELLGPMMIQRLRTERAFLRYKPDHRFLEARVLYEGNSVVRDLLLTKAHLIPPDLLPDASLLVEHYDRWFEKYEEMRGGSDPAVDAPFVIVTDFPFPKEAELRFRRRYLDIWTELYRSSRDRSLLDYDRDTFERKFHSMTTGAGKDSTKLPGP